MSSTEVHDSQTPGGAASGPSTQPRSVGPDPRTDSISSSTAAIKMPQYTSRDVGDPSQIKKNKQSMADLKLRRLTELNSRLREDLERERIPVSQAARSIIAYCNSTRDYMVPSVWGAVPRGEDPYAPQQSGGCCLVM
ncbi:GGL domain-containing protein [Hypomontagnella monticulosa]|nr:GGL domain-containing protein [Hypomontagnella monticulosa]